MLTIMLLLLATEPPPTTPPGTPAPRPTFTMPTWQTDPPAELELKRYASKAERLPEHLQPKGNEVDCIWAAFLMKVARKMRDLPDPASQALGYVWLVQITSYFMENCRGPNAAEISAKIDNITLAFNTMDEKATRARESAILPFPLPALPDRAGGDLGPQLWVMFQMLEARLTAAGHRLEGDARACAWASSALAAASAVQRTKGATDGIAAGAKVLEGRRATYCRGDALAKKEAAWSWLRAHPEATQPLQVAQGMRAPAWPAPTAADGALWLAAVALGLTPMAWPVGLLLLE